MKKAAYQAMAMVGMVLMLGGCGTNVNGTSGADVMNATRQAGNAVGDVARGTGNAVGGIVRGTGNAVGDAARGAGNAVGGVVRGTGNAVGDVAKGTGNAVGGVVRGTGNAIQRGTQGAGQAATDAANRMGTANALPGNAASRAPHMELASRISNALVRHGYATHALTFVLGNTAYVAVVQPGKGAANQAVRNKDKIVQQVRRTNPNVRQVYVSANPDVYTRFQRFSAKVSAGTPADGVWNNISAAIRQLFPTAH